MATKRPLIFPKYGDDIVGSNGLVAAGRFMSANDIAGGTLVGTDTAGAVFNSNGYFPNALSAVTFNTTTLPALAEFNTTGFTFGLEISADAFHEDHDTVALAIEYHMRLVTGSTVWSVHPNGVAKIRINARNFNGTTSNVDFATYGIGVAGEFVMVHYVGGNGYFRMYVNGFLWVSREWNPTGPGTSLGIGGGDGASAPGLEFASVRNLVIYNRPMEVPNSGPLIGMTGDSQSNVSTYMAATNLSKIECIAVDGDAESGFTTGGNVGQQGIAAVLHGRLAQSGKNPSANRIQHWGVGGLGVLHDGQAIIAGKLSERVTHIISGLYPIAQVMIIIIGTNDMSDTGPVPTIELTDGTWKAAYQTEIDRLKTAGVEHIVLVDVCERTDAAWLLVPDRIVRLDAINTQIQELTNVSAVVSAFSIFGGYNIKPVFLSDGVHFSKTGMTKLVNHPDGLFAKILKLLR